METLGLSMGNNGENGKPMKVISSSNESIPILTVARLVFFVG